MSILLVPVNKALENAFDFYNLYKISYLRLVNQSCHLICACKIVKKTIVCLRLQRRVSLLIIVIKIIFLISQAISTSPHRAKTWSPTLLGINGFSRIFRISSWILCPSSPTCQMATSFGLWTDSCLSCRRLDASPKNPFPPSPKRFSPDSNKSHGYRFKR